MSDYKRWYDEDPVLAECVKLLENIGDSDKRKTATFLMDEIVSKSPYTEMLPEKILELVNSESRRRRWYDFDEVMRIFVELLNHAPLESKKKIAVLAVTFIQDLHHSGSI